jgi:hypothetical protein
MIKPFRKSLGKNIIAQGALEAPFRKSCTQKARAQGALEYMLLISAAILVVSVVVIFITGMLNTTDAQSVPDRTTSGIGVFEDQLKDIGNFIGLSGKLFEPDDDISESIEKIIYASDPKGVTLTEQITIEEGIFGESAFFLNGNNQYISINNFERFNNFDKFSISFWYNSFNENNGSWTRLFDFSTNTNNYVFLTNKYNGQNKLDFELFKSGYNKERLIIDYNLNDNIWNHIVVTYKWDESLSKGIGKIYINGELKGEKDNFSIRTSTINLENFWFGKSAFEWDNYLKGKLFEIVIFDRDLTIEEVIRLYSNPN